MPNPFLNEANKAARARSAFSRLIAETVDSALAKLFDFFAAQSE